MIYGLIIHLAYYLCTNISRVLYATPEKYFVIVKDKLDVDTWVRVLL